MLAKALAESGRAAEALPLGERVFALQRAAQGADNEDTLWIEANLAEEYRAAGDMQRAEATYTDVVAHSHRAFTHGEWDTGHFEMLLAQVLAAERKVDAARSTLTDSIHVLTASLGPADARTQDAEATLAALK